MSERSARRDRFRLFHAALTGCLIYVAVLATVWIGELIFRPSTTLPPDKKVEEMRLQMAYLFDLLLSAWPFMVGGLVVAAVFSVLTWVRDLAAPMAGGLVSDVQAMGTRNLHELSADLRDVEELVRSIERGDRQFGASRRFKGFEPMLTAHPGKKGLAGEYEASSTRTAGSVDVNLAEIAKLALGK